MPPAVWNGAVLAESSQTKRVEGHHDFPPASLRKEFFAETATPTVCGWKGTASYYSVTVNGQTNRDAGWFYPAPKAAASQIKDYVAFWRGVEIVP